jgi:hypothetical protein
MVMPKICVILVTYCAPRGADMHIAREGLPFTVSSHREKPRVRGPGQAPTRGDPQERSGITLKAPSYVNISAHVATLTPCQAGPSRTNFHSGFF